MKYNISISKGNTKTGAIPAFSLTPGCTCSAEACKTCYKEGCYARKSYRMYPSVRKAWDNNTDLVKNNLALVEQELTSYFSGMNAPRFFRLHVSGDFATREYAEMWQRIATNAPHTNFLAFTKQWDMVRGIEFPDNFSLVLSAWTGTTIPEDLRQKYSVAWLDDGKTQIPENAMECPGHCDTCGACWGLSKMGIDVKFKKH
jgi:hypothetical protein